jgi:hypothetical protein
LWNASATINDILTNSSWNDILYITNSGYQKPAKIYRDNAGVLQLRTAGLPKPASLVLTNPVAGANRYLYALTYSVRYQVGNATFEDESAPLFITVENETAPNVNSKIFNIPTLANGSLTNYDTGNVKVNLYRTINGGVTYYRTAALVINNGTATITDSTADGALQNNFSPYFNSAVSNLEPPLSKVVYVSDGYAYYGDIKEGSDILPFRVYQSKASDPDSINSFVDLEDNVVGISSHNGQVIVFCNRNEQLQFSQNV